MKGRGVCVCGVIETALQMKEKGEKVRGDNAIILPLHNGYAVSHARDHQYVYFYLQRLVIAASHH